MEIRKLDVEEHENTRPLYEEVFPEDSKGFVDYYYTEKTKDNQIYVAEEDGVIRAMLHMNPYRLLVGGREKEAHYIVAVATQEPYRKRGLMAALIKRAFNDMYQAGEAFTYLMPAAEPIYLPHDFRTVYEQERKLYKGKLPDNGNSLVITEDGQEYEIAEASEKDCAELAVSANQYLSAHYQVFAFRDEAYYQRLRKEYASDGGKLILYRQNGNLVDCRPYVPENEETENPKIMARIIDARRMLMNVSLKSLMAACFCITDPIIEENNLCVAITGTEFSGAMLMDSKPENSEGTITIAALTSLLFGAKTIDEICREEGVEMTDRMKGEMKKIIPLSHIYLNEVV